MNDTSLGKAQNWLRAKYSAGNERVTASDFHDWLISQGTTVTDVVDSCKNAGWISSRKTKVGRRRRNVTSEGVEWLLDERIGELAYLIHATVLEIRPGSELPIECKDATSDQKPTKPRRKKHGSTINERMLAKLTADPTTRGWTARQWAQELKCGKSTVTGTLAWQHLQSARIAQAGDRSKTGHRR